MTGRDRIVIVSLAAAAILVAVWLMAVSPERKQAAQVSGEVASAQSQLQSAESQVASASAAQAKYQAAYAAIVSLGKAVPASQEVPSLIYQLAKATGQKNVEFASITSGSGSSGSSSSSTASAAAASAGFTQMPFTFVFNGTFDSLYDIFNQLDGFAQRTTAGDVLVRGRLLTVQSIKLSPSTTGVPAAGSGKTEEKLSGTITATAYVLPAGQTLSAGATTAGPAGATQTASTSGSSSTNTPAVIGANP
jgi:hypothetical protein